MQKIGLSWVAEYHGPNPLAVEPVVVAELTASMPPTSAQVAEAGAMLWAHSGIPRTEHETFANDAGADGLLAFAENAVLWAFAVLNEVRGDVQNVGATRADTAVRAWLGFHAPELSRGALNLALQSLDQLIEGRFDPANLKAELDGLWQACRRLHPDWQARILMVGAREMCVPYLRFLPNTKYWQFGWGANAQVFFETGSNADGALGWQWQRNKVISKDLMQSVGLPVPPHFMINREEELGAALERVGFPCVVKPIVGGGGKGVTANINDNSNLRKAFRHARQYSNSPILVEKHVTGTDFRLMVVNGRLVVAIRRQASYVTGDGASSVRELLKMLNASRFQNLVRSRYLRPVPVDDVLTQHLAAQGVGLDQILPFGQIVTLRSNANRSTGGICTDVTRDVHPQVRAMAEQLALATGLAAAGIDYLASDITRPPKEVGGAFIEINAIPGMAVCIAAGWSEQTIARVVLGDRVADIPVDLTLMPPEALNAELQSLESKKMNDDDGWVCGSELCIGGARLQVNLERPWDAVFAALRNRRLQRLQIFCTARDIERHGVPLARFNLIKIRDAALSAEWMTVLEATSRTGEVEKL